MGSSSKIILGLFIKVLAICNLRTSPPDNKFAFISLEGVGGEPGVVDVSSLEKFNLVTSVKVGKQAGGIAFWKISD